MEEKKRYAWIEMFRNEENPLTYDQMNIKESFDEFFKNVIKIDKGKDIQKYYKVSLHLIIFLTIQKKIRDDVEKKKPGIPEADLQLLELDPKELFWSATKHMPKAFIFSRVPHLTVPEEQIFNVKEIAQEIAAEHLREKSAVGETYQRILARALRGEELASSAVFQEDGFGIDMLQSLFKLFQKLKHNKISDSFYRKYETMYFLNCYCRDRFKTTPHFFPDEDIEFLSPPKNDGQELLPASAGEGQFNTRLADRKLVLILNACVSEFAKRQHLPKPAELIMLSALQVFLAKEEQLGYFEDYPAEYLLVCFGWIVLSGRRKPEALAEVHRMFGEMGFLAPFELYQTERQLVTLEDLLTSSVLPTYNRLLPSILRTAKTFRKRAAKTAMTSWRTPERKSAQGAKYILSPLSGRMSQILPVDTHSKKILFKDSDS